MLSPDRVGLPQIIHNLIQISREIRIHAVVNHDNVIGMYAAWKDSSHVYIALEWAPQASPVSTVITAMSFKPCSLLQG
jgi:serine/threonine protein kinase